MGHQFTGIVTHMEKQIPQSIEAQITGITGKLSTVRVKIVFNLQVFLSGQEIKEALILVPLFSFVGEVVCGSHNMLVRSIFLVRWIW